MSAPFRVSLSMAALSYRNPAPAWALRDRCRVLGHNERSTLYNHLIKQYKFKTQGRCLRHKLVVVGTGCVSQVGGFIKRVVKGTGIISMGQGGWRRGGG